jgi:hypothetical protein
MLRAKIFKPPAISSTNSFKALVAKATFFFHYHPPKSVNACATLLLTFLDFILKSSFPRHEKQWKPLR